MECRTASFLRRAVISRTIIFDVNHLAFRGDTFHVEGAQTIDHIGSAISVLFDSGCCRTTPFQDRWITG